MIRIRSNPNGGKTAEGAPPGPRLLLIDDEPHNLRFMEKLLRGAGYAEIRATADPASGVELAAEWEPDLLVVDLHMPGMDGEQVIRHVGAHAARGPRLPILVLSGDLTQEARRRCLEVGATDFLGKPFDVGEVLLRIRNHLETRRLHRDLWHQNDHLEDLVRARTEELRLDLARRRRAERLLRRQKQRLASLMESSQDIVALLDGSGRIRRASTATERLLGYPPRALRRSALAELIHPDDRGALEAVLAGVGEGHAAQEPVALRVRHRDGSWREHEALCSRASERTGGIVLNSRDVTERERTRRAMAAGEARYRHIVESASDMIFTLDVAGRVVYANDAAAATLGYPREALPGVRMSTLIRADARADAVRFYRAQLEARTPATYHELPVLTASGRELWLGQNVQLPVHDGEVRHIQVVARDITRQREMELIKDEFVSVVSHELRTPLTAIRASLGLLAGGAVDPAGERGDRMLRMAVRNTNRLMRIVNDMLDAERVHSGRVTLDARPCGVNGLLRLAEDVVRPSVDAAGVVLVVEEGGRMEVSCDTDRITQVLVNLLSNAIKFTPPGGTIWLGAAAEDGATRFTVRDQGRGIPAEMLESIFERFRQVDARDAREKGGSGLGLSICRALVQLHGGRIWAESCPGEGSCFSFSLPAR